MNRRSSLFCLLVAVITSVAQADDPPPPTIAEDVNLAERNAAPTDDAEQLRKQNTVTVGVLILVGVASVGLLLIAAALVWGAKVRRQARHDETLPTRQDDLWYLRKEMPPENEDVTDDTDQISP